MNSHNACLHLPEDIIHCIISLVQRRDLKSVSLSSHELAQVSRPYIFREFAIDVEDREAFKNKLDFLTLHPDVCGYIRVLVITGEQQHPAIFRAARHDTEGSDVRPNLVDPVLDLQNSIKDGFFKGGIEELRWTSYGSIPPSFIEAVQATAPMCLWVIEKYSGSPLPPMPNLVSLSSVAHVHADPLLAFQPVLLRAPRLRKLDIAAYRQTGCVVRSFERPRFLQYDAGAADKRNRQAYPPIEELTMRDHVFTREGGAICLAEMRWSHLRRLELVRTAPSALLQACIPTHETLPALEEFKLETWHISDDSRGEHEPLLERFMSSMASGLRNLHLEGPWQGLVPVIVEHHGKTLQSLVIHDHESLRPPQRSTISISDLVHLGRHCVALRHLELDVDPEYSLPGTDSTPDRSITSIVHSEAYFPALRSLTLWTLLGIMEYTNNMQTEEQRNPLNHIRSCEVHRILDPSVSQGSSAQGKRGKLETLVVNMGEQHRMMGRGYPARWVLWEQSSHLQIRFEKVYDEDIAVRVTHAGGYRWGPQDARLASNITHDDRWIAEHPGDAE